MAIFAIIHQPGSPAAKLETAIKLHFETANYSLGNGAWLVAGPGTAQDVAKKLGVAPGTEAGSAVVLEAASYFGRANPAIWSWMKANWEARPVG
jgi:hypothetical protein